MGKNIRQRITKRIILNWGIAIFLFGVLPGICFCGVWKEKADSSVAVVMMGDSIVGECRDNTSIPAVLAEMLDQKVINGGLGGTSMGRLDTEGRPAYTKDCLSMHALAQSIATSDFGVQQTVFSRESATLYFEATINTLEQIDFEAVDILFIGQGINDYHAGIPISDEEDLYDEYTFTGALRSTVEILRRSYPKLRIILLTPTYSWYPFYEKPEQTCENNDFGGGVLEDYVNAEIGLAKELGVEVIDLYHDFYPHEVWSEWELYTRDGLHPNEAGRQLIAEAIYNYVMR